ncbi:MAG: YraN family protein [Phycisphaerales bacterium]
MPAPSAKPASKARRIAPEKPTAIPLVRALARLLGLAQAASTTPARRPKDDAPRARADTRPLGRRGERTAARYLRKKRFRIVARNLVMGNAEADLVCLTPDRATIVIVEVKARRLDPAAPPTHRTPEAAITEHKQRKLRSLASRLGRRRRWSGRPIRIDVIAIDFIDDAQPIIRHHPDAVR